MKKLRKLEILSDILTSEDLLAILNKRELTVNYNYKFFMDNPNDKQLCLLKVLLVEYLNISCVYKLKKDTEINNECDYLD